MRDVLKLALEALEYADEMIDTVCVPNAITAIKQALEQPEERYIYGTPLLDAFTKPAPVQKRPQNCGTRYCSCVECVMEKNT